MVTLLINNNIKKRYIFIESGAGCGGIIELFTKTRLYSEHPWEIYAFEARPDLIPQIPKRTNQTILNKAIWIHDGFVKFYLGKDPKGSSILKHKKTGGLRVDEPVEVESINFGQWLKRNFRLEDFILVSFNIEGAEYDVLNNMLRDGTIEYIDELYVEFHNEKVGISKETDKQLVSEIQKRNVFVKPVNMKVYLEPDHNLCKTAMEKSYLNLKFDAAIGRIGIFLQKNYPWLYSKLKNIKKG